MHLNQRRFFDRARDRALADLLLNPNAVGTLARCGQLGSEP
jgi:hypothetical protein